MDNIRKYEKKDNIREYEVQGRKFTTNYNEIKNRLNSAYRFNETCNKLIIHDSIGESVVHIKDYYVFVWRPFVNETGISSAIDPYPPMRAAFNSNSDLFSSLGDGLWCTKEFAKSNGYNDVRPRLNNAPDRQTSRDVSIEQENSQIEQSINEDERPSELSHDDAILATKIEKYTKNEFLKEVYTDESQYDHLVELLRNKKNIILQGAPGVGKTFAAMRLAWSMMGEQDNDRIEFIQFHQNYSYEDFIMGYKPVKDGFELKEGVFYRFCKKAEKSSDKEFFFIIDEINRGNMSKIFAELLMLIENNYRGMEITLAYRNERFSVPKNLYIIGMMNTADRSLAMIDYALRRRFSFFEMEPGFDSKGFTQYLNGLKNDTLKKLISVIKALNQEISQDKSLGKGFCIGHSYVSNLEQNCTEDRLRSIVDYDILPMLSEYWFDDMNKLQRWENILRGIFQ
jgi:DNA replication protein DnaC